MEKIFLSHLDRRGLSPILSYLPQDFLEKSALFLLGNLSHVMITTGFYILSAGAIETDGPPGAIALGRAISRLGGKVSFVLDPMTSSMWPHRSLSYSGEILDFPLLDRKESVEWGKKILKKNPSALISIERCGPNQKGEYLNMRKKDISPYTAKIDTLFDLFPEKSIGIGDGGNEIGMGNLAEPLRSHVAMDPCITKTAHLILAGVSNWGAYGLVREMEKLSGQKDLLWTWEEEEDCWRKLIEQGVVDGFSGKGELKVDGFPSEVHQELLRRLRES